MGDARTLFDLEGRVALITGSSRGLGLVLARGLGEAGARVLLNGRDARRLEAAVETLRGEGLSVEGYQCDITDDDAVRSITAVIEREVGVVDILVNNAGIQIRNSLEEFAEEDWQRIFDINVGGAFHMTKYVVRGMLQRGRGKIINICSLQSELGRRTIAPYAATKGALKMLTRAMAVEWAERNIQVNAIGPGYFITDVTRPLAENPEFDAWLKARTPAHRWGDPKELVGAALFLASEASSFVNGQVIYVDGGILAAI
jgi:gluconate 5-dehydrogenase